MKIYTTINGKVIETDSLDEQNLWIDMVNPSLKEISFISSKFRIEKSFITAALDRDENSRIKVGHNQILILVNIPYIEIKQLSFLYNTSPLGIIVTKKMIITVSIENHKLNEEIMESKEINTNDRTSFIFHLLYAKTDLFLKYLKEIENKSTVIEHYINKSLKNEELVKLLN